MKTFDLGPIRPTSEAASLLIRVTAGCAWNRCRFCNNYRTVRFAQRPVDVLKEEIDTIAAYRDRILEFRHGGEFDMDALNRDYAGMTTMDERQCYTMVFHWIRWGEYTIFLQDADASLMKTPELVEILQYIRKVLPEATRITTYSRPDTMARKSSEEWAALKEAGLGRVHSGYESGSDAVLQRVEKGVTSEQQVAGGRKVMESGLELSVFLMAGLGGQALSDENADETARVINCVNPHYVRLRTTVVIKGTPLWEDFESGKFDECTDMQQLMEMRRFLDHLEGCTGRVYSDHVINLMQEMEGPLTEAKALVAYIDEFLALPREEQRRYQLAKRMGFNGTFRQMDCLSERDRRTIDQCCEKTPDGPAWEKLIKDLLRRYI